jgi:hypothetical protein
MSESVQIMMLDAEYDDAFFGLSYNALGTPFPVYSLDECARIASDRMEVDIEEAIDQLRHYEANVGGIVFVEEMPASKVGLRVVH